MAKTRNIQRNSGKNKGKPKLRFNFGILLVIFILSFAGCFALYMIAANTNEDFFKEEFNNEVITEESLTDNHTNDSSNVSEESSAGNAASAEINNPVPESAAVDVSYLENCCMITDSTLLKMKDYTAFKDVLGNEQLSTVTINETKIESSYGTVTAYEAMKIKKPMNIYIMLGSDLGVSPVDEMIANYTTFVNNLKASLTDVNIYIMQLPPVYSDGTVTNAMINEYNTKLLTLADNNGVYCIDTNIKLKSADGTLADKYWSAETSSLTETAYNDICGIILTHTV